MENTNYEDLVSKLEQSPLFNVSLASKELFHSNFIYWISQINKDVFKEIIATLLDADVEDLKWGENWDVRREHEHFDLCVVNSVQNLFKDIGGGKQKNSEEIVLFVLENKVKSIPSKKQLDEYWEKCSLLSRIENLEKDLKKERDALKEKTAERTIKTAERTIKKYNEILELATQHYLLLSLSTDFPDKQAIIDDKKWHIKNYGDLSTCFTKKMSNISLEKGKISSLTQTYFQNIVSDYCRYIESLQQLMILWNSDFEKTDSYLNQRYLEDYKAEKIDQDEKKENGCDYSTHSYNIYRTARKLRIHDIYGKNRVAILKQRLEQYLDEKLKDKIQKYRNDGLIWEVAYNFTNATPLLEVIFKQQKGNGILKEGGDELFWLHIQLQGNQYRHAINEKGSSVEESVKNISENSNYHFFLNPYLGKKDVNLESECEYPKLSRKEDGGIEKSFAGVTYETTRQKLSQRGGYCKYGGKGRNFIYQWKKIADNSTIEDIFKAILADIYNVLSHIDKFYYHINDGDENSDSAHKA